VTIQDTVDWDNPNLTAKSSTNDPRHGALLELKIIVLAKVAYCVIRI